MFKRFISDDLKQYLSSKDSKILFIWGPRRAGKTTLIKALGKKLQIPVFNFDISTDRAKFTSDRATLAKLARSHKIILIDEVQNHPESTVSLKILHDEFNVKIIATGSSELRQKSANFDTLAGRYIEIFCLPLSIEEQIFNIKIPEYDIDEVSKNLLNQQLIWGGYPEILTIESEEIRIRLLENILETYVLKDIINLYNLSSIKLAKDILMKIALQIGSEVSLREIANSLGTSAATVGSYIEIFAKNYVLIPLNSFKTNKRKAVSENKKYYFYDLGIRNALVQDFRDADLRPDKGGLIENQIIIEVEKIRKVHQKLFNLYFYREYGGKKVDIVIEDYKKRYTAFEVKNSKKIVKKVFPYDHELFVLTPDTFYEGLSNLIK